MKTELKLTGEDLWQFPDDGNKHELVRGELIVMPPPGFAHGKRVARISYLLQHHVSSNDLGTVCTETGFYLERDPDTVRGPDVLFYSHETLGEPEEQETGYLEIAPDLVVEVMSPGDSYPEVEEKIEEYLQSGVRKAWVVDNRRRTVRIYPDSLTLIESDTLTGGDVLPGFSVKVADIFR